MHMISLNKQKLKDYIINFCIFSSCPGLICAPFWRMPSSSQQITYLNANTRISGDNSRSICAWFRASSFNNDNIIIDIGSNKTTTTEGCNTHFTLLISDPIHIRLSGMCDMFNDDPIFVGPETLYDNAFHQICVTYNSINARLCVYRDFQQSVCTTRNKRPYNTSLGDIRIGWWPDGTYQFVASGGGLIRSISLFETEISHDCVIDEINTALAMNVRTNITTSTILPTYSTLVSISIESTTRSSTSTESTFISSSTASWINSTNGMPIVATNTYIQFELSFSANNEDLHEFQLESDLHSIFMSALDIYPNQINVTVNIPLARTLINFTAHIFLFDSVKESADSLLTRIYQQLSNSSSALRQHNLTFQLTNESISNAKRIYICDEDRVQETPCTTPTTSETSLTNILLASIIPSIVGGIIFGAIFVLIVKHMQRRRGSFFLLKQSYQDWTRF